MPRMIGRTRDALHTLTSSQTNGRILKESGLTSFARKQAPPLGLSGEYSSLLASQRGYQKTPTPQQSLAGSPQKESRKNITKSSSHTQRATQLDGFVPPLSVFQHVQNSPIAFAGLFTFLMCCFEGLVFFCICALCC